jgi:hypothetical protein
MVWMSKGHWRLEIGEECMGRRMWELRAGCGFSWAWGESRMAGPFLGRVALHGQAGRKLVVRRVFGRKGGIISKNPVRGIL